VLGHDVVAEPLAVRRRIGLAGQFAAVDEELTGRENVEMIGLLYRGEVERRRIPPEYVDTRRSAASTSPKRSSTSAARARASAPGRRACTA
jgi:ABC-type multidrug transport system ATPase subunit